MGDWLTTEEGTTLLSHFLFLEELSELLIRSRWDGATLRSFLTQVFDCPDRYELKYRKDPLNLKEPTLSLLACTTPALFWQGTREVDIHGGWGNRMLYLTGPVKEPISLPRKPDTSELSEVHAAFVKLDTLPEQEATLRAEAAALWEKFYAAWRQTELDPLTKAATERVPAYCLKLAMVYAAMEGTLPGITEEQLRAAVAVGRYAVRCTELLIGQRTISSRQGTCEEAVLKVLSGASQGLPAWQIHQRTGGQRFTAEDMNRAVQALEKVGRIVPSGKTSRGKPLYVLHVSRSR